MAARRDVQRLTKDGNFETLWDDESGIDPDQPRLDIDVDGFEGPLDLLLHLARDQKVDLLRISVLALVEQYLDFIEKARALRLELAADYLVMAAWLAYLKSRLLVPKSDEREATPAEELAAQLQFRLKRLEAMREASKKLLAGRTLGRDVFARGMPEAVILEKRAQYSATLYDLLSAYGAMRLKVANSEMTIKRRVVWSLKDARAILEKMVGQTGDDWSDLQSFLIDYGVFGEDRISAMASCFAVSLELVREGAMQIRQDAYQAPIYLRAKTGKTMQVAHD